MQVTFNSLPEAVTMLFEKLANIEKLLLDNSNKNESKEEVEKLISITAAAEILNLSVGTIYGKVMRNEIPFMKISKRLYFSEKELIEWIKTGRNKTIAESILEVNKKKGAKK